MEFPYVIANDMKIEMQFTQGLGSLYLLGVNPDSSFYVVREDVVSDSPIQVAQTVHYFNAEGKQLGVARVPIAEQYLYVPHNLAVGPDGTVYALVTRPDSVDVVCLNFFKQLEPLLPTFIETL